MRYLCIFCSPDFVVEKMITETKQIDSIYKLSPDTQRNAIDKRDGRLGRPNESDLSNWAVCIRCESVFPRPYPLFTIPALAVATVSVGAAYSVFCWLIVQGPSSDWSSCLRIHASEYSPRSRVPAFPTSQASAALRRGLYGSRPA
jgi:hypothetical protein